MKADIINFSNIFFGKPNICKVKFVELFLLVFCFFFFWRENYVRSWAFPDFKAFSLRAQKQLDRQPAMTYDLGNRE